MSALLISLDFELFWGVVGAKTLTNYGANIEGVWQAIPDILKFFKQYGIHATWATVGMLMCKDYQQWCEMRPSVLPSYADANVSTYNVASLAQEHPKLFFARPLVEQILNTEGQELASHTYSHFYCGDPGATIEQFAADAACQHTIFAEYGAQPTSIVFPRNQVIAEYQNAVSAAGITAYRGNQDHWLYRDGHSIPFGLTGRAFRIFDGYFPLSGNHVSHPQHNGANGDMLNIPASSFFRPTFGNRFMDVLHLNRLKQGMLEAAKTDGIYHVWWHPHNFGKNLTQNMKNLELLLQHFWALNKVYGMRSSSMAEIVSLNIGR